MGDYTKCKSKKCPLRKHCYRFTAKAGQYQSYFVDEDLFEIKDGKVSCEQFWGETQKSVMTLLEDIMTNDECKNLPKIGRKKS